jgi:hypothetical protein
MSTRSTFHICVLTHGLYPDLARRCLVSIERHALWASIRDVRIGFNESCPETVKLAEQFAGYSPVPCIGYCPDRNVGKYPLMRRMFYQGHPLTADYVMWFDDDSYLDPASVGIWSVPDSVRWWGELTKLLCTHDVVGSLYRLHPKRYDATVAKTWPGIRRQPWFAGRPMLTWQEFKFPTGGWWVASTELLKKHNWPVWELHHNGGDVLLGEMCRQQGYRLEHFNQGVRINANAAGEESAAKRRGIKSAVPFDDFTPIADAADYRASCAEKFHSFECHTYLLGQGNSNAV